MTKRTSYELHLPVFKQGDDLGHQIQEANGNLAEAFKAQASLYQAAAEMCLKMAGVAAEEPELEVFADTHMIEVSGPQTRLAALAFDELLHAQEWDEDEEWDEFEDSEYFEDDADLEDDDSE